MARRRRIGGDDEDGDYAAFLASRQPREDLFARALQLMQLQRQEQGTAWDRAYKERQAQADEMYRQGQLAVSERGETRQEKAAADALEREKTARIQEGMNRGEDVAYRTRQEQLALDKEAAAKVEKGQAQQQKIFEAAVDKGLIKPGDPEWDEWIKDLDPQAAERLTRVEGLKKEAAFKKGSEAYAMMPEKGRKALAAGGKGAATLLQEVGGLDVYKRIIAEAQQQQQAASKPNLTPGAASPVAEGNLPLRTFAEEHAPTAPSSDVLHLGPPLVDARDYSKFPGSVEDLIRASSGQPLPESRFAQPVQSAPPVASAPPQINMPRASQESIAPGLYMQKDYTPIPEAIGQYQPGAAFSRQGLPDLKYIPDEVEPDTIPANFRDITSALGDFNLASARNFGDILGSAKVDQLLQLLSSGGTGIPRTGAGLYDVSGPTTEAPPPYIPMPQGPGTGFPWPQQSRLQPFPG